MASNDNWVAKKLRLNKWLDVRVVDANDLEQWLELAPGTAAWASREIHRLPDGIHDIEYVWEGWTGRTQPALVPDLFLAGHSQEAEAVLRWLTGPPTALSLRANSSDEAVGFFAALTATLPEPLRERTRARTAVVTTTDTWRGVAGLRTQLVIVATSPRLGAAHLAVNQGHHVLIAYGNEMTPEGVHLTLSQPRRSEVEQALVRMGLTRDRAQELARETHSQTAAIVELLSAGVIARPPWAEHADAVRLAPLLLAGSWVPNGPDAERVSQLAGVSPAGLSELMSRWANDTDPPVRFVGGVWKWVSRKRAWRHLARLLTARHLTEFRRAVSSVLAQNDPRLNLPDEGLWAAAIRNAAPQCSDFLREGLAEGLALLATDGGAVQVGYELIGFVTGIVRELFGDIPDPNRWRSLAKVLRPLAEAEPDTFLEAVERQVLGCPEVLNSLFRETGMFGGNCHVELLWALETLVWSREHFPRVVMVMAGLTAHDPGGRLSNRLAESLRVAFCGWNPQTTAAFGERCAALDTVAQEYGAVAFELARRLLPTWMNDTLVPTTRPRWRRWLEAGQDPATLGDHQRFDEHQRFGQFVFDRLLMWAGNEPGRWTKLLTPLPPISTDHCERVIERLEQLDSTTWTVDGLEGLRRAVRHVVHQKRKYQEFFQMLTPDLVDRLAAVSHALEPTDALIRHRWLFNNGPEVLSVSGDGWEQEQRAIEAEQLAALCECVALHGPEVIIRLAEAVENPFMLGYLAGRAGVKDEDAFSFLVRCLDSDQSALRVCANGLQLARLNRDGWAWIEELFTTGCGREWPGERRVRFASTLAFESRTWDLVESWGAESVTSYWLAVKAWAVLCSPEDTARAIRAFLGVRRPYTAGQMAAFNVSGKPPRLNLPGALLLEVVQAMSCPRDASESPGAGDTGHTLSELLFAVERSGVAEDTELARIEWIWLSVLEHTRHGIPSLRRALSREPQFFADLLALVFRPDPSSETKTATDCDLSSSMSESDREDAAARASHAYRLLHEWGGVPGVREDGTLDGVALVAWAESVRAACRATGRGKIGDVCIGEVLARSPNGTDKHWPHEAVRGLVERLKCDPLEEGLFIGRIIWRGMTVRRADDGGEQERTLANQYHESAVAIGPSAPRTAAVLRKLAQNYRGDARREDERRDLNEYL